MNLPNVVIAGHICLDILPDMENLRAVELQDIFQPGQLIEIGAAALSPGGPVANTGLALHKLGISTRLMAKIGVDPLGQILADLVGTQGRELARGLAADPHVSTSYSVIVNLPGRDRIFLHHPGANHAFCPDDVDYGQVNQAALFHFGYPPVMRRMYTNNGQALVDLFSRAKQAGAITSLDMCSIDPVSEASQADWPVILQAALPYVDIFLPSIEELLFALRRPMFLELSRRGPILAQVTPTLLHTVSDTLLDLGVQIVVIKLGERGLYLRTGRLANLPAAFPGDRQVWADQEYWAPCFRVQVAGTTGAGDATIAGFLAGLLRGLNPAETVTAAVAIGACNVEAADALSGLRTWEATLQRMARGWERHPLVFNDPAWDWDGQNQLWHRIKD